MTSMVRCATGANFSTLHEPKQLLWVQAEEHFFKGALDEFERVIISLGLSWIHASEQSLGRMDEESVEAAVLGIQFIGLGVVR